MNGPEPDQVFSIYYWMGYLLPLLFIVLIIRAVRQDKDDDKGEKG